MVGGKVSNGVAGAIRVLHVDDDPGLADLAAEFLERADDRITVETATDAEEGCARLDERRFDCVVSDYDMPGRNGIDFLEDVRERDPNLPFILFTGKGSEEIASEAISAGVTDYLQKETGTDQYAVLANRVANAVEHDRSRRRVERSERRLREIIDALPHLLYVVTEDGTYSMANESLARFHDTTVEEIEGARLEAVLGSDGAAWFREHLQTVLETGEPKQLPAMPLSASDDDDVHVFETRLFPYTFSETDTRTVLGIAVDVTERKEREERLNALVERFESLQVAARKLVRTDDREEIARILAETLDEVFEYPHTVVRYYDDGLLRPVVITEAVREEMGERPAYRVGEGLPGEVFETGEPRRFDDLSDRDDGIDRGGHRSAMYLPIGSHGTLTVGEAESGAFDESDQGLVETLLHHAEAVLDQLDQQAALECQNERLEEVISLVSHDLRNPLNVAAGSLELVVETGDLEHLDTAAQAHERMRELIEDVLALAREGDPVGEHEPVSIPAVVEACWRNVDTAEATLRVETERAIRADRSRLRHLLENLFRNAAEHGSAGGQPSADDASERVDTGVTVTVGDLEDDAGFYVADDGPGIPPDERERVFESGYSTATRGTGFGLAIVRRIAAAHGWEVAVTDSEAGGARFEITGVEFAE
ncbi:response regulator [Halobellus sp. EA9]|uniref:PAS domain-containing sensor histidine kinase n=1 Tax=Halobellus sp. EA9 TaxID=3421647 RepID=UPI003EBDF49E